MGAGENATFMDCASAYELGKAIAQQEWVLLTGGRNTGVMDAASRGAKSANGLTIGILPGDDRNDASEAVDIAIVTGMGNARNNINVLSSDVIIACGTGAGTISEIALGLKANKPVILLNYEVESQNFWQKLSANNIFAVSSVEAAIATVKTLIEKL